ncbi:MAG: hypothetical protein WAN48_07015 [Actinomycetes bacterium]
MTAAPPPGWPREVLPPDTSEWADTAVRWLLDHCPPEYRGHDLLRRQPVLLSWLAARQVDATLEATREAYRSLRRERPDLGPETLAEALTVLEAEGARLLALQRAVHLVRDALTGQRYVPRL